MPEGAGKAPSCPHYPPALLLLLTYVVGPPVAAGRRRCALTSPMEACIVALDMFRRPKITPLESEDLRRMGRLEAAVESLELKWVNYRDEIKKLVNRLEKREERLEKKLREIADETVETPNNGDESIADEISQRVNARRQRHGLHGS